MLPLIILIAVATVAVGKPVEKDAPYFPTYEQADASVAYPAPPPRYQQAQFSLPPSRQTYKDDKEEDLEEDDNVYDLSNIPGNPGVDFPILHDIPRTKFTCSDKRPGFYADVETGCQVWHYCDTDYRSENFLCPNGTIYTQERRVCDWWYNVDCTNAEKYYSVNEDLYIIPEPYYKDDEKFPPEVKPSYTPSKPKPSPPKYIPSPEPPKYVPQQQQQQKYLAVDARYPEGASSFSDPSYIQPEQQQQQYRARNYKS